MPSKQVSLSPLQLWTPEARKLPSDDLKIAVPLHVLFGEAVDVARFYDRYHDSADGRPGLQTVADKTRGLTRETAQEILSLREAAEKANITYQLAVSPGTASPMERATFVVNEITAALEWLFDDGVEDERDAQLENVKKAHADTPDSHDAWASELESWAALASEYKGELDGLGGFDLALLPEARQLAAALRDRPAVPTTLPENAAKALALRNRLATLLSGRMSTVRAAARFVFRHHPDVIREATSAYARRRKAAHRRATRKPGGSPADTGMPAGHKPS